MKKIILGMAVILSLSANAQNTTSTQKGKFETQNFESFKLHVYYTNDAMGDASYIIEGNNGIITLEQPLFKDNVSEFDSYVTSLNKPVEKIIADYHLGSSGEKDIVMAKGMPEFVKAGVYGGMMQSFAKAFGDAIVSLPTGKAEEFDFGETEQWDGISFTFQHGASTDFPAASIIIGNKVYFTHWAPAKAHISHLQITSKAAIDAEIEEATKALNSSYEIFIGGHGGKSNKDAVEFKIEYLKTLKKALEECKTGDEFVVYLKKTYPNLPGESGLNDLAKVLYPTEK